jgi:eukaryotic-like serine/threonine-protein kinase
LTHSALGTTSRRLQYTRTVKAPDRISHYVVESELGRGGMGVVYRARDTQLERTVALKILLPGAASERFLQEARTASAFAHPGIVTIHEIGECEFGRYLVFEYVEGQPLSNLIPPQGLPLDTVLRYATQVAAAIAAAHEHGIVHRDLKPANIMVTADDRIKLLDFGLAKRTGALASSEEAATEALTSPGTMVGTVQYMSPEQAEGKPLEPSSDIFSFGAVLYEMATGHRAFGGDSKISILAAVMRETPVLTAVPNPMRAVVSRCLEKNPGRRYADGAALLRALQSLQHPASARRLDRTLAAACAVVLAASGWFGWRTWQTRQAREVWIPESLRLFEVGESFASLKLGSRAAKLVPNDPRLIARHAPLVVETEPDHADVYLGEYLKSGTWEKVGTTPLRIAPGLIHPFSVVRYKIAKPGYDDAIGTIATPDPLQLKLLRTGEAPAGMVAVAAGAESGKTVPAFWIDRYEVTNAEFKRFVDSGGYRDSKYWKEPFLAGDGTIGFQEAMKRFTDATGRPGPATWRLGSYKDGEDRLPVTGVSWYEAMAYAAFAGKSLPTVYHWRRAAGFGYMLPVLRLSNFSHNGLAPVGQYQGLGPFGTYDMAGNASEWVSTTAAGGRRYLLGGNWNTPSYQFVDSAAYQPMDRDPAWGFRCVRYPATPPASLLAPAESVVRDPRKEKPVSDETFQSLLAFYTYEKSDLKPEVSEASASRHWRQEFVTINAAYGGERLPLRLYLPLNSKPPYQVVILLPTGEAVLTRDSRLQIESWWNGAVVESGRAILLPVLKGTFERLAEFPGPSGNQERTIDWAKDVFRSIDYIETRPDLDHERIGLIAMSLGARYSSVIAATEPRIRAAVLLFGGFPQERYLEPVEPVNFAPRVRIPVLMLNSRQDFRFPLETSQNPLFDALGSPAGQKKHVLIDAYGHYTPRQDDWVKEIVDWYDAHLGPVK